ncbi:L-asparagine oxygenase [Kibdelosporangium banguiense]|uniref:L-asparagine oxygenase n=1 Tax=Kibdelosporangium banguiense TaxID=1365924 RepID=A0ABS4TVL2_9PSEU|nr:TauD/TfdA family dioxygenase [Kibdelosporangium banguiense]MBP2328443.1 L-asparagine oxygenase [Kibdelosporangium banguiense]
MAVQRSAGETVPVPVCKLGGEDASSIAASAHGLTRVEQGLVDHPGWVAAARSQWEELPGGIRRSIRDFRRDSGRSGALVVRGMPIESVTLAATPQAEGSVQRHATLAAAGLLLVACGLGEPGAFQAEKSGALVQDVVPVRGHEEFQGNAGSATLTFHSENAFHEHRPDYVLLLCLRSDHEAVAGLRLSCIRTILPRLSSRTREALFRAEFATHAPPSFGATQAGAPEHAVLTGAPDDPDFRVDFAATQGLSADAAQALAELSDAVDEAAHTLVLSPGDLAIVDNRVTVHGRTAFRPRYDGKDRWLQRSFSFIDLRRSRDHRPSDGYVLVK